MALYISTVVSDALVRYDLAMHVPTYRCTFTLPQTLATDIAVIAKRLSMSQSALLSLLLEVPIADIAKLVAMLPPDVSSPDDQPVVIQRLRGASIEMLRSRIGEAVEHARVLDPGLKFE